MLLKRWLSSMRTRLRGAAVERELEDELRIHLEMAIEENLARGMSERRALREARRSLGVVSSIKEARRQADSLYWLDTVLQDLRYGARILHRAPRFSVAVVVILGLGIGMTTAVFAIVDSLLLNAVPFGESQRLVELYRWGLTGGGSRQPVAMVENWRSQKKLFDGVETYDPVERVFTGGGEPETMQGAQVSPGLFPLLGFPMPTPSSGSRSTCDAETLPTIRASARSRSSHDSGGMCRSIRPMSAWRRWLRSGTRSGPRAVSRRGSGP